MPATSSTSEAMALLKQWRAAQIAQAREVAIELITRDGSTSSRRVQEVMAARNLIDEMLGNYWIGAIFNDARFKWTGRWEIPQADPSAEKNKAHAWRPIKVWMFAT